MIGESLAKLGWSPSEIKVYLQLLKGCSYANRISAETGINRTNVYEALDRLVLKGVVSFVSKNKVKWYEAKGVDSILSIIRQKEQEFILLGQQIREELKEVDGKKELEATIFTGKKGLRMLFEEMLLAKKPISILGAKALKLRSFLGPYFMLWQKRRQELLIKQRTIFPLSAKNIVENDYTQDFKHYQYKLIEDFDNPTTTIIFGDVCLLIQWSDEPMVVKIKNKGIADSHQNYFNSLWNSI